MKAELCGSTTRVGMPPMRSPAPRTTESVGTPREGSPTTRRQRAAGRTPGRITGVGRSFRSSRTSTLPVVASRQLAVDPAEIPVGVAGIGGSTSASAATTAAGGSAGARQGQRAAGGAPRAKAQAAHRGQGPREHQPPQPPHQGARTRARRGGREQPQRACAHAASSWTAAQDNGTRSTSR